MLLPCRSTSLGPSCRYHTLAILSTAVHPPPILGWSNLPAPHSPILLLMLALAHKPAPASRCHRGPSCPTRAAAGASRRRGAPSSHRGLPALLLRAGRRRELRLGGVAAHLGALARLGRRGCILLSRPRTAGAGGLCRCACVSTCVVRGSGAVQPAGAAYIKHWGEPYTGAAAAEDRIWLTPQGVHCILVHAARPPAETGQMLAYMRRAWC